MKNTHYCSGCGWEQDRKCRWSYTQHYQRETTRMVKREHGKERGVREMVDESWTYYYCSQRCYDDHVNYLTRQGPYARR